MIRGIFIASLMFCHLALAQQAPTPGVPATCDIRPNPGETKENKGQIASQMSDLGLAKPSEAQVRCIMNTPREGRKAKLQEMIAAQQGQQQLTPEQAAFLKTKTFPDSVFSLPVKNIGVENQLMVIDGFQKLNFIIELSPEIVAKVPLDKNMPLYCKTPTCTLVFSNRMTTNPPGIPIFTANGDFDIKSPSGQNPPPPQTTGPPGQATPPATITVTSDLWFIKLQGQLIYAKLPGNAPHIGIDPTLSDSIANMITPRLKCSEAQPCTLTYKKEFQSYTSGNETKSLPVYTIQGTPPIWDGDSPGKNPPSGQALPPPTLAQQYPDIPFKSGQPPLMISPTGNTNILSALLPDTKQIFFVAIPLPQGQNPTVTCKDNTCAFKIKALQVKQPIYELTGNYNINTTSVAPPAPPETLSFGTQGIALTKTALGENHIMALYPPDRYIAIRFDDYNLSLVLTKNKPMLTCNPTPNNTCSLVKTGVMGVPEKSKYIIKEGSSTIVDAEPSPAGTPGGTQQPQFLPEITIPKDTLIPGQRIAMSDQVVTKNNNPEYTMLIELAPDTLKNAQPGSEVNLKCTSQTCKLTRRTAQPEKPIYTVSAGTLVLADTPTPAQVVPGGTQQPQGATLATTPQGGQAAGAAPTPAAKQIQYEQELTYKKDVLFMVKKIGSNQVLTYYIGQTQNYFMVIEFAGDFVNTLSDQSVQIKCTAETCKLKDSGNRTVKTSDLPGNLPIYKIDVGTFALEDTATPAPNPHQTGDKPADLDQQASLKNGGKPVAPGQRANRITSQNITLKKDETLPIYKTTANQIRAAYNDINMILQLDESLANKVSGAAVLIKCTAKTCSLQNSGNLSDPDGMPIYTVGAGSTFALEDTATPSDLPPTSTYLDIPFDTNALNLRTTFDTKTKNIWSIKLPSNDTIVVFVNLGTQVFNKPALKCNDATSCVFRKIGTYGNMPLYSPGPNGKFTIVEASTPPSPPTATTPPVAVPDPTPAANQIDYAQKIILKADTTFVVYKTSSNQVMVYDSNRNPVIIQLEENLWSQIVSAESVLKCVGYQCELENSGNLSVEAPEGPGGLPIYNIRQGTFTRVSSQFAVADPQLKLPPPIPNVQVTPPPPDATPTATTQENAGRPVDPGTAQTVVPNTPVPPSITLNTTGVSFKPDYDKKLPIGERVLKSDQLVATLNGNNIKIKVTADLKNSINEFLNSIDSSDITLKLACSKTAGCPLTDPDANERYTIKDAIITKPDNTLAIKKMGIFDKNVLYQVTYVTTTYKNARPTHYVVKFSDRKLALPMSSITNSSAITPVIARGIALQAASPSYKPFTFKIKCKSDFSCFTSFHEQVVDSSEDISPTFYGKVEVSE